MPNRNYRQGTHLENRVGMILTDQEFYVIRAGGSHGVADLVALYPGVAPVLIQCKTAHRGMSGHDWNQLYRVARHFGATPVLATYNTTRRKIIWTELTGAHAPRSPDWPGRPYVFPLQRTEQ